MTLWEPKLLNYILKYFLILKFHSIMANLSSKTTTKTSLENITSVYTVFVLLRYYFSSFNFNTNGNLPRH